MFKKINFNVGVFVAGLVFLVVCVFSVTPIAAQAGGGRISYGDSVSGTISDPHPEWVFRGTAGDVISIAISPEDGPVNGFVLRDDLGALVVEVGGMGAYANRYHLDNFMLPMTGAYRIIVGGSFGGSGDYTLSLRLVEHKADAPKFSDKGDAIDYNTIVAGRLTEDEIFDIGINGGKILQGDIWTFSGKRGDIVGITVTTTDLHYERAEFQLLTVDGAVISTGNTIYPERGVVLPITGDYLINVLYSDKIFYDLSLQLVSQTGDDGIKPQSSGKIEYGKLVLGLLNEQNSYKNTWTFDGKKGDVISIAVHYRSRGSGGPTQNLYAPGEDQPLYISIQYYEYDDTHLTFKNLELPATGTYALVLNFNGIVPQQWAYGLAYSAYYYDVFITSSLGRVDISRGGNLEYGTTRGGEITDANLQDKWTFQGTSGDQVTITMKRLTGDIIADFEVFGPDGASVGAANAAADRNNAELLDFNISTSGTYTIVARPFSSDKRGTYSINVTKTN